MAKKRHRIVALSYVEAQECARKQGWGEYGFRWIVDTETLRKLSPQMNVYVYESHHRAEALRQRLEGAARNHWWGIDQWFNLMIAVAEERSLNVIRL